jgi:signal transduction histidine kinase
VPAYLESILLNLVTNGIKYKHPKRVPHIIIKTFFEGNHTCLVISDNGLGIDLDQYGSRLFKMNETFHNNADARGIGLYITKNQIEKMGGCIEVKSEVDKGTTFKIKF